MKQYVNMHFMVSCACFFIDYIHYLFDLPSSRWVLRYLSSCLIFNIFFSGINGGGPCHFLSGPLIFLIRIHQIYLAICRPHIILICVILFLLLWMLPDYNSNTSNKKNSFFYIAICFFLYSLDLLHN